MGNWYLPSGEVLTRESNTAPEVDFYRNRRSGGIDLLRRNNATLPEGVFRCEIPRSSGALEMVYVGLYAEGNGECREGWREGGEGVCIIQVQNLIPLWLQ